METERQFEYIEKCRSVILEREQQLGRALTFYVETFGCQMNERDSEKLRGILESIGFVRGTDEESDLVLYNTCTVRENANTRVYGRLGGLHNLKKKNPEMIIGLCGCMMQEEEVVERIRKDFRFVDLVFGTHNVYMLAELLYGVLTTKAMTIDVRPEATSIVENLPADRTYPFKSGVNIMYGCDNFCSYCIVPYVRGRERSRKAEDILEEVKRLADDGVVEIMLLGQNVNSYGKKEQGYPDFARLLRQVCRIDGIKRVRFMTSHPKDLSDDLIRAMAEEDKVCNHLHLPLQSGSSRILKAMNRKYDKERYLELTAKIREAIPDISLTTDIIVGFPQETEEDLEETLDVVRKAQFDSAFTFIYSKRTGTPAASMEQVPPELVKERFDRLLSLVQETAAKRCARFLGRTMDVLAESVNRQDKTLLSGRTENNLVVHFPGDAGRIGKIVPVELTQCKGFYYYGKQSIISDDAALYTGQGSL